MLRWLPDYRYMLVIVMWIYVVVGLTIGISAGLNKMNQHDYIRITCTSCKTERLDDVYEGWLIFPVIEDRKLWLTRNRKNGLLIEDPDDFSTSRIKEIEKDGDVWTIHTLNSIYKIERLKRHDRDTSGESQWIKEHVSESNQR